MSMFYLFFGIEKNTFRGEILVFILFFIRTACDFLVIEPYTIKFKTNMCITLES